MEETIAVVIKNSGFRIDSIADNKHLQAFLEAVPGRLEHCRSLHFAFFSRFKAEFQENKDLELCVCLVLVCKQSA